MRIRLIVVLSYRARARAAPCARVRVLGGVWCVCRRWLVRAAPAEVTLGRTLGVVKCGGTAWGGRHLVAHGQLKQVTTAVDIVLGKAV